VSAATVGAVLASRRPSHPVGWLLLVVGLSDQFDGLISNYVHYGVMGQRGGLPAAASLSGFNNSGTVVMVAFIGFIALLTPTGKLPSPWWRWWARIVATATVVLLVSQALDPHPLVPEDPTFKNPLAAPPALVGPLTLAAAAGGAILLAGLVVAAGSLVVCYRRARGTERQQLRWLALAATVAAVALLVAVTAAVLGGSVGVVLVAAGACVVVLPLATGAAILRYRLYDLDRIISRTLAYGLLTLLLGLGYAAVVLGPGAAAAPGLQPGRGRSDPCGGGSIPAGPPPHPAGGRPALQPAPLRRRPDHCDLQCPPARRGRSAHAERRVAGGRRPDHAADPGVAVAAAADILQHHRR
jgi:hypothetical protein